MLLQQHLKLYLITTPFGETLDQYQQFIRQAISGGVTAIQLRDKSTNTEEIYRQAHALQSILIPLKIPLIINDHVDIAVAVNAAGIHLGQSDGSPVKARQLVGQDKWIGLSVETQSDLEAANRLTCIDYIAASAVFPSRTKQDCKTIWGLDGLRRIIDVSHHPVIAIGGIDAGNIRAVMGAGASGAAVCSAIQSQVNPEKAARHLIEAMN